MTNLFWRILFAVCGLFLAYETYKQFFYISGVLASNDQTSIILMFTWILISILSSIILLLFAFNILEIHKLTKIAVISVISISLIQYIPISATFAFVYIIYFVWIVSFIMIILSVFLSRKEKIEENLNRSDNSV